MPVSGPYGMGEFARCAAIARAVLGRWPGAQVHFVLSREAPYAAQVGFPATWLASSATFHSAAVIDLLRTWRPHVVVFDNAGRGAQLQAARRLGARIVYISARRRQRRKAFRLNWMRMIDEHWIAYPKFIAGELRGFERLKLELLRRPAVRYLDVIFPGLAAPPGTAMTDVAEPRNPATNVDTMEVAAPGAYPVPAAAPVADDVLVVPGGGTGHPGSSDAMEQFLSAARRLAARGFTTRFVGPASIVAQAPSTAHFHAVQTMPQSQLAQLMRGARLVVVNGGSTLLQSIACGAACVAAPIARDQLERIRRCAKAGVAVEADLRATDIEAQAAALLRDEPARAALARRAAGLALADGLEVALAALGKLLDTA